MCYVHFEKRDNKIYVSQNYVNFVSIFVNDSIKSYCVNVEIKLELQMNSSFCQTTLYYL